MRNWLRKPMLHFWLIGLTYYVLSVPEAEPLTVQYPDEASVTDLRSQWLRSTGRAPSDEQLEQLVQHRIDQEILLQEAIRLDLHLFDTVVQQRLLRDMRFMGEEGSDADMLQQAYAMQLHINDEVARRRLVQAMESILRASGEQEMPDDSALLALYEARADDFTLPAVQSFSHVFVSRDKHAANGGNKAAQMTQELRANASSADVAKSLSDPFLSGLAFNNLSQRQIARHFGDAFAAAAFECPTATWCGPVESAYGWHVLLVAHRESSLQQPMASVKDKLLYMARRQQGDQALADKMRLLREQYEVIRS